MRFTLFSKYDFILTFLVLVLLIMGLTAVYSATNTGDPATKDFFNRQVVFAIVGFIFMLAVPFIPFRFLERTAYPLYIFSIILLVMVYFFGVKGFGAERWLQIGSIKIQPSEIAKLASVLAIARYLSNREADVNRLKDFLVVCLIVFVPFVLIVKQPDLGTSLVFVVILIPLLFWAGLKWFPLFLIISPGATALASFSLYILVPWVLIVAFVLYFSHKKIRLAIAILALHIGIGAATPLMWDQLKPYQKNRIITFLNPEKDPRGAGYQIIQSQVAVGSGGIWGKGFMNGTQTHLKFLPAQHTDFIFSVIAEEWGFSGVLLILVLFVLLLVYLVNVAITIRSPFGSISIIGITSILFFHIFVNVGMTVGVAPVTGLPLPLISYGGSFLIATMVMIGVVQNIIYNKFTL